jgi:putative PIN family toxin of toxin-antitoxin system
MRVVLDANIYVSALISDKGNPAAIINSWLSGEFDILISQPILDELLRVTSYERIQNKYRKVKETRLEFAELIAKQGTWIEPVKTLSAVTRDKSDNVYLECAVEGEAQYIVSGDEHLLELGEYQGIIVLSPASFVILLQTNQI